MAVEKQYKVIVEKHPDGYVAYPLGLKGVVVGQGDSYEAALNDVRSAIRFHLETFVPEAIEDDSPVLEAFVAETGCRSMPRFPVDAPKSKVVAALERLGFRIVRDREHVAKIRENPDGTRTPLTLPSHSLIKGSTLGMICRQSGITRDAFPKAYEDS